MKKHNHIIPIIMLAVLLSSCATNSSSNSSETSSNTSSDSIESSETVSSKEDISSTEDSSSSESSSSENISENNDSQNNDSENNDSQNNDSHNYATDFGGYYKQLSDTLSGGQEGEYRKKLTSIIQPKGYYTYSGSKPGHLGSVLPEIDEDPNNPNNMILFYTQLSVKKQNSGNGGWNREHTWPQSNSEDLYGTSQGGADVLHIRPTYYETNSARGSHKFGNAPHGAEETSHGVKYAKIDKFFEPMDSVKGDCARICMYMWVTYFAERHTKITANFESIDVMLQWHELDPVSDAERLRNKKAFESKQQNRNPFVDYPDIAQKIFA